MELAAVAAAAELDFDPSESVAAVFALLGGATLQLPEDEGLARTVFVNWGPGTLSFPTTLV